MTKYQELRNRINQHCPDLLELKFGCEVKFDGEYGYKTYTCVGKSEDYYTYWKDKGDPERCNFTVSERDGWKPSEILGTPPTLQDVLRAIDKSSWTTNKIKGSLCITSDGDIADLNGIDSGRIYPYIEYDLTKPLSEQSEETLDFLLSVISAK